MVRKVLVLAAVAFCGAWFPASAGESYVGLSYLDTSAEFRSSTQTFDTSDSGWKIFGGYNPIKYFGFEVTYYDMGNFSATQGSTSINADISVFDLSGRGILPLGKIFDLTGKLGFSSVDVSSSSSTGFTSTSGDGRAWELLLGVGLDIKIGERFMIRADYETWDVETSLDAWSVGGVIRFGSN